MSNKVPGLTAALKKGREVSFDVIEVTPALAEKWLATNDAGQRSLRKGVVETYARDMAMGKWTLTHQPIAFNGDGVLVDGQHRLSAVIMANTSVRFVVSVMMDLSVHDAIDRGAKRSIADLMGGTWNNTRVAVVNTLYTLQLGDILTKATRSKDEIQLCYECNKDDLEVVFKYAGGPRSIMTAACVAALAYTYPLHPVKVLDFAEKVRLGEGLSRSDLALTFRNWLIYNKNQAKRYSTVDMALATCGILARVLRGETVRPGAESSKVYVAPTGYRFLTQKRRAMEIPNTPGPDLIRGPDGKNTDNLDRRQRNKSNSRKRGGADKKVA